jgi:SNF2 family DNA or RNA helicase
MGLGKTMEILGLIKNSSKRHNLLLCPKAVVSQWRVAAGRSRFNVLEVRGQSWFMTTPFRAGQPMLFVTNYEKLMSKKVFGRLWDRVILDEAQRVRVRSSKIWAGIHAMTRSTTWCVSATPVVNSLKDIKNLFELVGYKKEELAQVNELMGSACLHRSMAEMRPLLKELPCAPTVVKEYLDFDTEDEAEFYRGIQGLIMRRWRSLERDQSPELFSLIMRLRQISVHPQVYIEARKGGRENVITSGGIETAVEGFHGNILTTAPFRPTYGNHKRMGSEMAPMKTGGRGGSEAPMKGKLQAVVFKTKGIK